MLFLFRQLNNTSMRQIAAILLIIINPIDYGKNVSGSDSDIVDRAWQKSIEYGATDSRYTCMIDYSKPIDQKRLYVVDLRACCIALRSTVSHAENSGKEYAKEFSNEEGTLKSSLGAYLTKNAYYGAYGYSLVLDGLDKGINSNAKSRMIVFHSSKKMRTKWSWGCFATPEDTNSKIIGLIKDGSLVYVYK